MEQKEEKPCFSGAVSKTAPVSNLVMQNYLNHAMYEMTMQHNHPSVMVLPFKDEPERVVKLYRPRRVVSPFEFILEYILDGQEFYYDQWFPRMQKYYGEADNQEIMKLNDKDAIHPNACFAYISPDDKKWHRVRVHNVDKRLETVTIFLIDLCKLQEANIRDLYKLCPSFVRFPAPLFRCYLYDIAAKFEKDATYTSPLVPWSKEACQYFQDVVLRRDKVFEGIVFTRSDTIVTKGLHDIYQDVGVVLAEKLPKADGKPASDRLCTVNAHMVDKGYAVPTGIFGCCQHTLSTDGVQVPSFSRAEYDYLFPPSARDYANALNCSAPRVVPTKQELRSIFGSGGDDKSTELPFISSIFHKASTNTSLPKQFAEKLCQVIVCYIQGPGHIILHQKHLLEDMEEMQKCIESQVANEKPLEEKEIRAGMVVACHIIADDCASAHMNIWCRAVVKGKVKNGTGYKVLLVDYGNDRAVNSSCIRRLPEYFAGIPCFAIRAHIDVPTCVPRNLNGWTTEASLAFRSDLFDITKDEPYFYLYRDPKATSIPLQDYGQDVRYSHPQKKWIPGLYAKHASEEVFNAMRNKPLISSLFVSHGIELFYEFKVKGSIFWYFAGVSEILNEYGGADSQPAELHYTKKDFHQKIFEEVIPTTDIDSLAMDVSEKMTSTSPRKQAVAKCSTVLRRSEKKGNPLMDAFVKNNIVPEKKLDEKC